MPGVLTWLAHLDRVVSVRTRIGLVLVALCIGAAAGAIFLAIDAKDNGSTASTTTDTSLADQVDALEVKVEEGSARIDALEARVAALEAGEASGGTTGSTGSTGSTGTSGASGASGTSGNAGGSSTVPGTANGSSTVPGLPGISPDSATPPSAIGITPSTGEASMLKIKADPSGQLKYTTDTLTAKAGDVTVDFTNPATAPHSVAIAQGSKVLGETEVVTGSDASTEIKGLEPGTYQYYCTVPGHRDAGMEGTLTVK